MTDNFRRILAGVAFELLIIGYCLHAGYMKSDWMFGSLAELDIAPRYVVQLIGFTVCGALATALLIANAPLLQSDHCRWIDSARRIALVVRWLAAIWLAAFPALALAAESHLPEPDLGFAIDQTAWTVEPVTAGLFCITFLITRAVSGSRSTAASTMR